MTPVITLCHCPCGLEFGLRSRNRGFRDFLSNGLPTTRRHEAAHSHRYICQGDPKAGTQPGGPVQAVENPPFFPCLLLFTEDSVSEAAPVSPALQSLPGYPVSEPFLPYPGTAASCLEPPSSYLEDSGCCSTVSPASVDATAPRARWLGLSVTGTFKQQTGGHPWVSAFPKPTLSSCSPQPPGTSPDPSPHTLL